MDATEITNLISVLVGAMKESSSAQFISKCETAIEKLLETL